MFWLEGKAWPRQWRLLNLLSSVVMWGLGARYISQIHSCSREYGGKGGQPLPCAQRERVLLGQQQQKPKPAGHRGVSLLFCKVMAGSILANFYLQHQILTLSFLEVISSSCCGKWSLMDPCFGCPSYSNHQELNRLQGSSCHAEQGAELLYWITNSEIPAWSPLVVPNKFFSKYFHILF